MESNSKKIISIILFISFFVAVLFITKSHAIYIGVARSTHGIGACGYCHDNAGWFSVGGGYNYGACCNHGAEPWAKGTYGDVTPTVTMAKGARIYKGGVDYGINVQLSTAMANAQSCWYSTSLTDNWWAICVHISQKCPDVHDDLCPGHLQTKDSVLYSIVSSCSYASGTSSGVGAAHILINQGYGNSYTTVDPITPQKMDYGYPSKMNVKIVRSNGTQVGEVDSSNEDGLITLDANYQFDGIGDTDNEKNLYYQIGSFNFNIQTGSVNSGWIKIFDQSGNNITNKCYFVTPYGTDLGMPTSRYQFSQIVNRQVSLRVPYDGVITGVKISGNINYTLTYQVTLVAHFPLIGQSVGAARAYYESSNIDLNLESTDWDFKSGLLTVTKVNKQAYDIYGVAKGLSNFSFKIKNTIREQYATNTKRCYIGYDRGQFVCNATEDEAYIFTTNSAGKFYVNFDILGKYEAVEIGTTHYAYELTNLKNITMDWHKSNSLVQKNAQYDIAIYGKVWEDVVDNSKNVKKDGKLNESQDKLLNDVIVRLKYDRVPMSDIYDYILQENINDPKGEKYSLLSNLVVGYPGYSAGSPVEVKYTLKTGSSQYKFFDVRYSNTLATYRCGNGEFGFIGLHIDDVLAGRYTVEFEYDGIIYKEVDASTFIASNYVKSASTITRRSQSYGNSYNLNKWNTYEKYTSKAYEYQSISSYPTRGRDEFNYEFSTVQGLKSGNKPDSYAIKKSKFVNAQNDYNPLLSKVGLYSIDEKTMNYTTKRFNENDQEIIPIKSNPNEENYKDYSYFTNTQKDQKYNIVADTANFNLNFKDLFVYGDTEYIDYVNLGLYRRDEASINLESDLVQVQVNMNGYKHLYWYAQEAEDKDSLFNSDTPGVKFHKSYAKGYRRSIYTADAKYQDTTDVKNQLEVYVTYVLKLHNTGTGNVDIGVEEITAYHNDCLEEVAVGFNLEKSTGKVYNSSDISYSKTHVSDPVHGDDDFRFVTSTIKINKNTNIINCHGEPRISGTAPEPATVLKTSSDAQKDCSTLIFIKYKLTQEKIHKISLEDSIYDEYLHQIFEVSKYSLYKQEQETTKGIKDGTQKKGKYYPFAGVITGTNPENCDPCENKHQLMYFESDTAYAPIIKLEFSGERGLGGMVVEDDSVLKKDLEIVLDDTYKLGKLYKETPYVANNDSGILKEQDKLYPFNTRNGDGTISSTELNNGVGGVPVLLRSVPTAYMYYNEENKSSTKQSRIMLNYRTVTVENSGTYGFKVKLIKRANTDALNLSDELKNVPEYNEQLTLFEQNQDLEGEDLELAVSYTTVASLFEKISLDEVLEEDEMRHYVLKNNIEVFFEPCSTSDAECKYIKKNMKAGEYYFPDVVPNNYKMNFMWNGQQRLAFKGLTDEQKLNNITSYTTEQFKSSLVKESQFAENASKTWYTTDTLRRNDAIDSYEIRKIIDKYSGESQDTQNYRDTLKYGDYTMISYSPKFILKIESKDNQYESDTIQSNAFDTDITEYIKKEDREPTEEKIQDYDVSPIDFALTLRPQQSIDVLKTVSNIKLVLADGTVLIDQDVYWATHSEYPSLLITQSPLQRGNEKGQIEIILDESLRSNANIIITYRNEILNISEIDYAEEKYYHYGQVEDKENSMVCLRVQDVYEAPSDNFTSAYVEKENQSSSIMDYTEITTKSANENGWVQITDDQYLKEQQPTTNDVATTDAFNQNRLIHADEIKASKTITENIVKQADAGKLISEDNQSYISENAPTNTKSTIDWKSKLISLREQGYYTGLLYFIDQQTAMYNRKIYKAVAAFQDQLKPGQLSTRLFKAETKLTGNIDNDNSNTVFNNLVEIGSTYSKRYEQTYDIPVTPIITSGGLDLTGDLMPSGNTRPATVQSTTLSQRALYYYGSPIKYCTSAFKAAAKTVSIIPPTGGNRNYTPYVIVTISAFVIIAFGICIILKFNKFN